jgi:hypothetical protein
MKISSLFMIMALAVPLFAAPQRPASQVNASTQAQAVKTDAPSAICCDGDWCTYRVGNCPARTPPPMR